MNRIKRLAGLLLVTATMVVGGTGCQLGTLLYFLLPERGIEPPVELKTKRGQKTSILVIGYADPSLRYQFDAIDSDLAALLGPNLEAGNKKFKVIEERKVRAWKDKNARWFEHTLQAVGEQFDVDYVYFFDIRKFTLNETKNQYLYQGATKIRARIHDIAKNELIHDEDYTREYPPNQAVPVGSVPSEEAFKRVFLKMCAMELSWKVVAHYRRDQEVPILPTK